ncbi:hypothetical protein DFH07DRAFT_848644 [Mycena maculata]|uniref:Secreted protein n=1 Tax=Mycena maculata TaxID=230809 RepID=A0AAD7HXQ0_9AGAR|nr:hypothetical protein DFH07DRAFT_848644 [Mycena maculata]
MYTTTHTLLLPSSCLPACALVLCCPSRPRGALPLVHTPSRHGSALGAAPAQHTLASGRPRRRPRSLCSPSRPPRRSRAPLHLFIIIPPRI